MAKGEKTKQGPIFCNSCGAPIPGGAKFCRGCGTPVASAEEEYQTASFDKTIRIQSAPVKTKNPLKPAAIDLKPAVSYLSPEPNAALALYLSFSGVMVAGSRSKIWGRVQNRTGQLIQDIEGVSLEEET